MLKKEVSIFKKLIFSAYRRPNYQQLAQAIRFDFGNQSHFKTISPNTPFTKFKKIKTLNKLKTDHQVEENQGSNATNHFMKECFSKIDVIMNHEIAQEDKFFLITDILWANFYGLDKLLSKNSEPMPFLGEILIQDPSDVVKLSKIVESFVKKYELDEKIIHENPSQFGYMIKVFHKYEVSIKQPAFRRLISKIIEELMAYGSNLREDQVNLIFTGLKRLSEQKHYLRGNASTENKANLNTELNNIRTLETEALRFLMNYSKTNPIKINAWFSYLFSAPDSRKEIEGILLPFIQAALQDVNDIKDLAMSVNKAGKLKQLSKDPRYSELFMKILNKSEKKFKSPSLTLNDVGLFMTTLHRQSYSIPDKYFHFLWRGCVRILGATNPKDLNIFHIGGLMFSLVTSKYFSPEKMVLLQDYALLALENGVLNQETNSAEDNHLDEAEEDPISSSKDDKNIFTFFSYILGSLSHKHGTTIPVKKELVRKIFTLLVENVEKMSAKSTTALLFHTSNLLEEMSQKEKNLEFCQEIKDKCQKIYISTAPLYLEKVHIASVLNIGKLFRSLCQLEFIDKNSYIKFEEIILQKSNEIQGRWLFMVLQGIAYLKRSPVNQLVNTSDLEKSVVNHIISTFSAASEDDFKAFAHSINEIQALNSFPYLIKEFQSYLSTSFSRFTFKGLIYILYVVSKYEPITILNNAIPLIKNTIYKEGYETLRLTIHLFIKNNAGNEEIFKLFEGETLKRIKEYLKMRETNNFINFDFITIFHELSKFNIQDPGIIQYFEGVFEKDLSVYRLANLISILTSMGTNLSSNTNLMKRALQLLNYRLSTYEKNVLLETSSLIQGFQHAIYTIEVEYSNSIQLDDYPEINNLHNQLKERIEEVRYRRPEKSELQDSVVLKLKELEYNFQTEYPIGIYLADIFIEPNIVLELNGPSHYVNDTNKLVQRSEKKRRQLEKLGYKVRTIPYFQWWNETSNRSTYLKDMIES